MKKKVLFALIALVSFVTSWAALPPGQQEQVTGATLTTTKVVYNGSATLAPAISTVTLSTGAQSQKDYKFYAVTEATKDAPSFTKDGAPEERDASKVPTHVGFWYAWFHEGPNKFGVKFEVEKATLKIDLLQISKYVGENDPNLTFETIGEWAQITGWGEGDDITNTTINGIQFKRVDVGEDAYAEDGSQKQYTYTLEEGLTATTTILGTAYENYNVGIGQSSKLLINKSILYVAVKDWCQSKTFGENDPDFNTARSYTLSAKATEDATANIGFVIPEGTTFKISRATGNNAGQYAFQANPEIYRNYEKVIFTPANFTINPKPINIAGATFSESYVYEGKNLEPKPTEVWYMNGSEKVNLTANDYTVTYGTNNRRDVTGTNQNLWPTAIVTPKGNYKLGSDPAKTVKFQITKAPLKFAIGDNYKVLGENDPNPLASLTFSYNENKGLRGTDKTDAFAASVASQVLTREAGEDFGQYAITVKENATLTNYSIESSTPGTFYIIRGENTIVVKIDNASITYEDEYDLTELVSVELPDNFQGNESVGDDLYKYVITQVTKGQRQNNNELVEVTTDNVGRYIVYIKNGPEVMGNYKVVYLTGNLTINRLNLYIQPDKGTKVYGDDDPAMTAWSLYKITSYTRTGEPIYTKYTKEVDVPQANYLGGTSRFDYRIQREDGENVGTYTTSFTPRQNGLFSWNTESYGTRSEGNYIFQTINGEFVITKADLTIKVSGTSKTYGDPDPTTGFRAIAGSNNTKFENNHIAIEIEGAKRREARSIAQLVGYGSKANNNVTTYRTAGEDAGAYDIKNINAPYQGNGHNTIFDNYTVKFNEDKSDDKFTINPRHLKVKANDQSIKYGTEIDPYDLTVVGGNYNEEYDGDVNKKDYIVTKLGTLEDTYEEVFKPLTTEYTQAGKVFENAFSEIELTDAAKNNYVIDSYDNGYLYIEQADVLYLDMKDLAQALNDHRGRTVEVRLCGAPVKEEGCDPFRQFVAYQWNTLVLPFTAMPREISEAFRYAVIDTLNVGNNVENSFSLAIRTRRIDANTPFIIQTDKSWRYDAAPEAEANPESITFGQRKIADFDYLNDVPTAEDAAGNKIIGTYKPKSDFTAANYIMRRNSGEFSRFIVGKEGVEPEYDMIQTEAYLQAAKADGPVRVFIDEEDGSTTAIEFVDADAEVAAEAAEGWYTVTGVKLDGEPTVSGTYIFNGKKVFFQAK